MADEPNWQPADAPPWAKQEGEPNWQPAEAPPPWAAKPERSVLQRAGEAAKETFMSGARAWVPPSKEEAQSPLSSLGRAHQQVMSPITMTVGPIMSGAGSLIASGVSEAARRITGGDPSRSEEMYEHALPMGEAAVSALGVRPGIAGTGKFPMPDPRLPTVKKVPAQTAEAEAARYLEAKANDPDFRTKLAAPVEEIAGPGDVPTTFQHTGVQGIGQAEKAAARRPGTTEEHLDLKRAQNAARQKALADLQPSGAPTAVSEHLTKIMELETTQADRAFLAAQQLGELEVQAAQRAGQAGVEAAQQRGAQAVEGLRGTNDPTTYGNIMRRSLQDAEEVTRAYERELWSRIDPNLPANPWPLQELERGIYGVMREGGAAEASLSPAERTVSGVIQNMPQGVPFSELRTLRSMVSAELRKELATSGSTPAYARLSRLRAGIEEAIARSVPEDVYEQVRAATAATARRAEIFRAPGVKEATRREGVQGPYRVGEASVPDQFIRTGPGGYDRASNYLRAVGQPGLEEFADAVAAKARRIVINPDGTVHPTKLQTFLRQHQETLRAIDERDGGAFSARLRNLQTAQETMEAAEANRAATLKAAQESSAAGVEAAEANRAAIAKKYQGDQLKGLLGAVDDAHIERVLGGIFGRHDAVPLARQLMDRLRGNNAAIEGARSAVVRHIRERLTSNAPIGPGLDMQDLALRAEQFQKWVTNRGNNAALRQILRPEQVDNLERVALSLRRATRTNQTKAVGGGSDTYQNYLAGQEQAGALTELSRKWGPWLGRALTHALGYGLGDFTGAAGALAFEVGVHAVRKGRAARKATRIENVQELFDEAILNPEKARALLGKTHTYKPRMMGQRTGEAYAIGAERTRERRPERALRQTGGGVPAIGGTGGRSLGTTTPPGPRAARAGTGQALQDGGTAGDQQAAPVGGRERWAAALKGSVGGEGFGGGKRKPSTALTREDIVKQLRGRGLSAEGWEAPSGTTGESRVPAVDSRADGGEVGSDDDKLPLPGQSRGLRSTAGPTVSSTTREEDIPAPKTNKAGETLPTHILKEWGKGMVDLAKTPGRVYREGMTDEDVDFGPSMALNMMGARTPTAAKPGSGIGMFGGRSAKTADLDKLAWAEKERAAGRPRESIWNQSGWWRMPDAQWAFEIPDREAAFKPTPVKRELTSWLDPNATKMSRPSLEHRGTLGDVMHHPELYKAYPEMADIPTEVRIGGAKPRGGYLPPDPFGAILRPGTKDLGSIDIIAPRSQEHPSALSPARSGEKGTGEAIGDISPLRILLHEGMHGIQHTQEPGWTGGSNSRGLPYSNKQIENMARQEAMEAGYPWYMLGPQHKAELMDIVRFQEYNRVWGEALARLAENRRHQELGQRPPWEDLDIKWEHARVPKDAGYLLGFRPHGGRSPWKKPEPADARKIRRRQPPGYAEGGEVDWEEDKLPLPGQSRGLRSTAGPTVTSTTREEDIPKPITNKAGETLPTHVLRGMGQGLLDLATAPKRAYTGELPPDEQVEQFGGPMGMLMTGVGRSQGTLGVGRSGRGGRRPPPREPPADLPPPPMGHNMPPEAMPVEPQPKSTAIGRMRALRELPYDEAMARAKTEQHLVPRESGGFEGAPEWVKGPEDLARLRAHLDEQAKKGVLGRTWYERGQQGVEEMAGPDPARQKLVAQEKALFSPKAMPETNLGFAIQAHNAYQTGKPLDLVYDTTKARFYKKGREEGNIQLGKKTGVYAQHLTPAEDTPAIPVNDIHHLENFQYENPEGGASAATHAFMDAETLLAADRANQIKLGGHTDWTPGRVQAAAWVEAKAQSLMKSHGWSYDKAMGEAMKAYIEHFPKHTAYGTHEATPGIGTRHLPGIAQGTEAERAAFAADPRSSWRDPSGRDVMYQALGMWTRPSIKATGIYEGPAGLEINPADVARPMVSFEGQPGKRQVDPASRRLMDAAEAARAYMDVQNAGAWSIPIRKQQVGESTSAMIDRPGAGPLPISDIGKLQAVGGRHGLPGVIDYGEGTALTSFGGGPTGKQLARSTLPQDVEGAIGITPSQVKLDTGYIDYQSLWGKKEGTGKVTRELKKYLVSKDTPAIIKHLDASPELRQAVAARMERDAEIARRTGQPIRADVQRARSIFTQSGFEGLFRALRNGAALPAAAFAPLVELLQREEAPVE